MVNPAIVNMKIRTKATAIPLQNTIIRTKATSVCLQNIYIRTKVVFNYLSKYMNQDQSHNQAFYVYQDQGHSNSIVSYMGTVIWPRGVQFLFLPQGVAKIHSRGQHYIQCGFFKMLTIYFLINHASDQNSEGT